MSQRGDRLQSVTLGESTHGKTLGERRTARDEESGKARAQHSQKVDVSVWGLRQSHARSLGQLLDMGTCKSQVV